MHPPLQREHPDCQQIIADLTQCHKDHTVGKWFGACNEAKTALDRCFLQEKERKRHANWVNAQSFAQFQKEGKNSDQSCGTHSNSSGKE